MNAKKKKKNHQVQLNREDKDQINRSEEKKILMYSTKWSNRVTAPFVRL